MIGLCLASGALSAYIATTGFTLAWTHSIEKQRWEEDWRVEAGSAGAAPMLNLLEGRIRGSGAGMEPPENARLQNGVWHYPVGRRLAQLDLAHSSYTAGYELCIAHRCRPLHEWLPGLEAAPQAAQGVRLWACHAP